MRQFNHFLTFVSRNDFVALDVPDDAEAIKIARMIAEEAGCAVIVRDDQMVEIDIIPAPTRN